MYRILLPVDHDPDRLDEQLDALFDLPGQAELSVTVIHIHEEVDIPADEAGEYIIDSLNRDIAELQGIPETVDRAVSELEDAGIFDDLQTAVGEPIDEIIEAGESLDVDAYLLAAKRRSPVGKAIFGSVTQGIIARAEQPVIVA
ncbi:universal stress protein [Halolamina salifodinae]|uniref:Nucleotide-binding universal stress UspA family protein n=1 Tax=Halolamina salifodinae TaxID=1202767 RepID=A0A8T4GTY0_9EURY|nr:universal stress protein [Halolamina salifodinae]MBP1986497.1 nucleotide-binding universal stress UspA family protein [Halolamina salifodinae]